MIPPAASSLERPASRFLLYSHDGFGLGHTRRHVAIAAALTELAPQSSVLLASGADDIYRLGVPPRVEVLKLPGLRKVANGHYRSRRLGIPAAEIRALRAALLETTVKSYRPDVVLVDKHPLGASGEFTDALAALKQSGGRAVLGLRDILDERTAVLTEWNSDNVLKCIDRCYDLVLVYGERAVFDPILEYQFSHSIADRTRFCGYILNREDGLACLGSVSPEGLITDVRPLVVATAGGGEDGFFLLETFIRAAESAPWRGVAVAGPMTPEHELRTLLDMATESNVVLHSFLPNLPTLFHDAAAVVCMGGYNTLVEALATGVPIACVPRISPRREQQVRAQAFERLGLLHALQPEQLSVETLRQAVQAAMLVSRREILDRVNSSLSFEGARHAAGYLLALAGEARTQS